MRTDRDYYLCTAVSTRVLALGHVDGKNGDPFRANRDPRIELWDIESATCFLSLNGIGPICVFRAQNALNEIGPVRHVSSIVGLIY